VDHSAHVEAEADGVVVLVLSVHASHAVLALVV
jgi:hypothetical protein